MFVKCLAEGYWFSVGSVQVMGFFNISSHLMVSICFELIIVSEAVVFVSFFCKHSSRGKFLE